MLISVTITLYLEGYVYDYDETGVHRNINGWAQSVAVPIVKNTRDPAFTYMWDAKLHEFTLQADWAPERYVKGPCAKSCDFLPN